MLEFDEEVVKFKLKGVEYEINKPSNGQIKKYTLGLRTCEDNESKENALMVFLEGLGLASNVYDDLKPNQMKMIIDSLYEAEKN